ncbi:MAG: glycerol-3-phosphate 1-O-acyltransferase PlsY [Candidatus Tectomicrobia bacterium]|nr:glycerol-3-phosphate 1-O-acyltransferase PlsY [Candidatus Tectomicrobia bacterium]
MLTDIGVVLIAYLIGSIPFGFLFAKCIKGIDIRLYGSHGIGATNVLRTLGKGAALLTFLGDTGKGVVALSLAKSFSSSEEWVVAAALAALIGHCYPIFLNFQGGKGVATGLGVVLILTPQIGLIALGIWGGCCLLLRYVSLSSLVATCSIPFLVLLLSPGKALFLFSLCAALLISYRHHENIRRLLAGTEPKIGQKLQI